jgi:hypothetical protein
MRLNCGCGNHFDIDITNQGFTIDARSDFKFYKYKTEFEDMTRDEFDKFQAKLLTEVVEMRNTKGKEYANSESRFANFDRLAGSLGLSNIQIAWVYLTKHLDGIASYCRTQIEYSEPIEGRVVDAIVYLTLIAGMIKEKRDAEAAQMQAKSASSGSRFTSGGLGLGLEKFRSLITKAFGSVVNAGTNENENVAS